MRCHRLPGKAVSQTHFHPLTHTCGFLYNSIIFLPPCPTSCTSLVAVVVPAHVEPVGMFLLWRGQGHPSSLAMPLAMPHLCPPWLVFFSPNAVSVTQVPILGCVLCLAAFPEVGSFLKLPGLEVDGSCPTVGRGKGLLQVVINSSGRFHGQFLGLRCFDEEEMLMADYFSLMILRGISS